MQKQQIAASKGLLHIDPWSGLKSIENWSHTPRK